MENDEKTTGFAFWSERHTWEELTDTWESYDEYLYFRMNNDNKN